MNGHLKITSGLILATILLAIPATCLAQQNGSISNETDLMARQGPSSLWNQPWSSGTRTDLKPEELLQQNQNQTESKTTAGVCAGVGAGVVGYKVCYDEERTVSVSANAFGLQATIYDNPQTGNMGGGIGVGGELRLGSVGVGASAIIAGDKEKGLVTKTSVSGGPGQITETTYESDR